MNSTISFPAMATYLTLPAHCKLSIGTPESVDSQNIDVLIDLCQNAFRRLSQISMQHVHLSHIDYVNRETVFTTQSLRQSIELLKQLHDSTFTLIRARLDYPWPHQSVLSPDSRGDVRDEQIALQLVDCLNQQTLGQVLGYLTLKIKGVENEELKKYLDTTLQGLLSDTLFKTILREVITLEIRFGSQYIPLLEEIKLTL